MNIKKILAGAVSSALVFGALAIPVFAAPADYNPPEQASACGQMHGAFQYYSHGYMLTFDTPRAADGQQTGENNSAKSCQSHFVN